MASNPIQIARILQALREHGFRETMGRANRHLMPGFLRVHSREEPSLRTILRAGDVYTSGLDLAERVLRPICQVNSIEELRVEYEGLSCELSKRYPSRTLTYPEAFGVQSGSAFLLYAAIRLLQPEKVVETGVANGHSSYFLLRAMDRNQKGVLHSIEVKQDVGVLLDPGERSRWKLHIIARRRMQNEFLQAMSVIGPVDIFIHDSDHQYGWQSFELNAVLPYLSPSSLILSDDVDVSYAFLDFCSRQRLRPIFLLQPQRVFGLVFNSAG